MPVIQHTTPTGGATLAPDAGNAGGNTTINPTGSRLQQQAAAATAAQQTAARMAAEEKQLDEMAADRKKRLDSSSFSGWGARAAGETEAPDRTMTDRATTEIRATHKSKGENLGENVRTQERNQF